MNGSYSESRGRKKAFESRSTSASEVLLVGKNTSADAEDLREMGSISELGRSLEEGMATHSSTLASKTPWTEEPSGLQSIGSQRVRYN